MGRHRACRRERVRTEGSQLIGQGWEGKENRDQRHHQQGQGDSEQEGRGGRARDGEAEDA